MTCREYQFQIGTERAADLANDIALNAHVSGCAECAQAYAEMRQLSAATSLLLPLAPSADFSQRVRRQVRETAPSHSAGLLQRLFGPLRDPAPALQMRHVFAGVAVILVAIVLLAVLIHPAGTPTTAPTIAAPSIVQPAGGQAVDFKPPQPNPSDRPGAPTHSP